jgi:transposase InsO family protein
LLPEERATIIDYAKQTIAAGTTYTKEGYRRLTYQMIDKDICYCAPATVYKVLKETGLLNKWKGKKTVTKGTGFKQPEAPHRHWHMDIKYINFKGGFVYFISVLDGFSRAILHHELRAEMKEKDVQIVLQRAYEKYPEAKGKTSLISDNGKQFLANDFSSYLKTLNIRHIKTSPMYPQSNGKIERFHRTLNEECITRKSFIDNNDIHEQFREFVDTYNNERLHSALHYLPPITYLNGTYKEKLTERKRKLEKAAEERRQKNKLLAA